MNELRSLSAEIKLNSIDYLASITVENGGLDASSTLSAKEGGADETATATGQRLVLELDELNTANQWRGVFESDYIEDLTRRTGNFKAFPIFVNMLQTALKQESKSLSLDLLTFNDLEMLRNKKGGAGGGGGNVSTASSTKQQQTAMAASANNNKRVLILTYNVEFDRINYPLQLGYHGKHDPIDLLKTIKELKIKLNDYERQDVSFPIAQPSSKELARLQKENDRLKREKELIEMEFFKFKTMAEAKMKAGKCNEPNEKSTDSKSLVTMSKENKLLKQMIKTLEESAMKEKNSYQKQLLRKKEEINELNDEIFRLKSSERTLSHQIKAYNNEAAFTGSRQRSRDHSRDSLYRSAATGGRTAANSHSRVSSVESVRRRPLPAPPAYPSSVIGLRSRNNSPASLNRNSSTARGRSNSAGRRPVSNHTMDLTVKRYSNPTPPSKSLSRGASLNNSSESIHSNRSSRKQPAAFNPTEFVKNKALRQREIEASRKQSQKRPQSRTRTPSSCSLNGYESDRMSTNSYRSDRGSTKNQCQLIGKILNDDILEYSGRTEKKHFNSLVNNTTSNQTGSFNNTSKFDRETELFEIDHKLKSLELLIKNSI